MPAPMLIRARANADGANVRLLIAHDMESGQRHDAEGRTIPAWYIRELGVRLNGRAVMTAHWGPSVSRNPFLEFQLRGAKAGDTVSVSWLDNRGDTRTDEAKVA